MGFFSQTGILLQKTFLLAVRNWKATIVQILAPIVLCAMLFGFQIISNNILDQETIQPKAAPLGVLQPCRPRSNQVPLPPPLPPTPSPTPTPSLSPSSSPSSDTPVPSPSNASSPTPTPSPVLPPPWPCTTMLYAPNVPWVNDLMERVALKSGLDFNRHFHIFRGNPFLNSFLLKYGEMYQFLNMTENQNTTQNAIIFKSAFDSNYKGSVMPADPGYFLFYNSSNGYNPYGAELVKTLNEAILSVKMNVSVLNVSLDLSTSPFPNKFRISQLDVVGQYGGVWFFLPPMITFFIVLTEIVGEKESRLRIGMRMMGLSNGPYWLVWWLYGSTLVLLSTTVLVCSGLAFQFSYFTNANIAAIYMLFVGFGMAITSFAMFIAAMINSVGTAQTVGYAFVLVGFVFQTILSSGNGILVDMLWTSTAADWVIAVRWILTFYPPFNMAKVYSDIAAKACSTLNLIEGRVVPGVGFYWADLVETRTITLGTFMTIVVPSPLESLGWMALSGVIYLIFMWYLDNVLPGEHGSPRPLFFPFQASYWGCRCRPPSLGAYLLALVDTEEVDVDIAKERDLAYDFNRPAPLRVLGISKVYRHYPFCASNKDLRAVDNLSLVAEEGEILCLLGHNGAGKTTLVNMLTGLFAPTSGTAYVGDKMIQNGMDSIREHMGVCPQHDTLWPELTSREHLRLFARLKGFEGQATDDEVDRVLQLISLDHVADNPVSSYSGGMKRRLSVGISTIGNPSIIFMDEPTTGLDPVNKRKLWHMIQDLKKDRVIVLTTHSMDEADVLSDKVVIMAKGKIHCVGTSLHLKHRFGSGYRINVVTTDDDAFIASLTKRWPSVKLEESEAGSLQFTIPLELQDMMPAILDFLEKNEEGHAEWGISHATLEEVFLNVTKKSHFGFDAINENQDAEGAFDEPLPVDESEPLLNESGEEMAKLDAKRKSFPFRALFRKNLTLQGRQRFTNFCQIITPVLVVGLLLVLQLIIKYELGDNFNKAVMMQTMPYPLNDPLLFDDLFQAVQHKNFSVTFPNHDGARLSGQCTEYFYYADGTGGLAGNLSDHWPPSPKNRSGLLGEIIQNHCVSSNGDGPHATPYFFNYSSIDEMNNVIFKGVEEMNNVPFQEIQRSPADLILPDGYISFDQIDIVNARLRATLSVNDNPIIFYHRANNFTRSGIALPSEFKKNAAVEKMQLINYIGKVQLVDMVARAFVNFTLKKNNLTVLNYTSDGLANARVVQEMPTIQVPVLMDVFEAFGVLLYPIAMNLQLPIYIFILVLEKKSKVREMMKSHGMKTWHYYLVNYIFFFVLYAASLAFFWISGIAVNLRVFVQTHWSVLLSFYLSWGFAMVSLAFTLSSFVNDPRAATVTGYGVAMLGTMISLIVCLGIYGPLPFQPHTNIPWYLMLWPQFPYVRGIYLMNFACATALECYGPIWQLSMDNELAQVIVALTVAAGAYYVIFLYLDAVLPREYGIPKHPLFFVHELRDAGKKIFQKRSGDLLVDESDEIVDLAHAGGSESEDRDVALMRKEVDAGNFSPSDPLVTNKLRKVYDSGKLALVNLDLIIRRNTCFGLLGENGAGKTTTISMLTGLYPPTSGWALVGGYDIRTEIDKVHLAMGLCPQFDVLWDDLTPKEHLLFYARIKGIDPSIENAHVNQLLKDVGLYEARHRAAIKLSGGMRRRLSLAVSLVGDSKIVFLDEPTTGLDPATRRHIWSIIARTKKGRAIILTTHSMDEAETLCNMIGILAHGTLRCLGSPQHLRSTHGEGFRLTLTFHHHDADSVDGFVSSRFPAAVNVSRYRSTAEYRIPSGTVAVSTIFVAMEKDSKKAGVKDWALNQLGLDDVFQAIVRDSNRGRTTINDL